MEGQTERVRFIVQLTVNKHIRTLVRLMSIPPIPQPAFVDAICHSWSKPHDRRRNDGPHERSSVFLFPPGFKCSSSLNLAITPPELHADISEAFDRAWEILSVIIDSTTLALGRLLSEFGHCMSAIANSEDFSDAVDIQVIVLALHRLCQKLPGPWSDLPGLS